MRNSISSGGSSSRLTLGVSGHQGLQRLAFSTWSWSQEPHHRHHIISHGTTWLCGHMIQPVHVVIISISYSCLILSIADCLLVLIFVAGKKETDNNSLRFIQHTVQEDTNVSEVRILWSNGHLKAQCFCCFRLLFQSLGRENKSLAKTSGRKSQIFIGYK